MKIAVRTNEQPIEIGDGRMTKKLKRTEKTIVERPPRAKLSAEESLERTREFDKRREEFIGSIRKGTG